MPGTTVIMVLDADDPKRGAIRIVSTQQEAARVAEDLLEAGTEFERIRIFDATELSMKVEHKPVVSLGDNTVDEPAPAYEELPVEELPVEPEPELEPDNFVVSTPDPVEETEEPLVRNGIRFSSLFKSDDL
jgi:hypothetical protein